MANLDHTCDIDHRADAIANYSGGFLACLAGPGTGKTYSFLKRIETLVQQRHVPVEKICYLTFIKEICKAFATDYEENKEPHTDGSSGPVISTLHSIACRLVWNQGFRCGYSGPLYFISVADARDTRSQVFQEDLLPLIKAKGLRTAPQLRKVLGEVKKALRDNIDPESLLEPASTVLSSHRALSPAYQVIDWDQAIPLAHELLQTLEESPTWIARMRHLLVDEYQDFNRAEQLFLSTLSAKAESVVVVGDQDQSIYSSRGGSPAGLQQLYSRNDVDKVTLVRCYRCKSEILSAANALLASMHSSPRKMSPKHEGGRALCYRFKSAKAEIDYLADYLKAQLAALPEDTKPKDGVVCLFPKSKALPFYMDSLSERGVACHCRRKPALHPGRAHLERALELIYHPGQRFLERLILEDFTEIKPRHKREMVKLILENDISPTEALKNLVSQGKLSGTAASSTDAFCNLCQALSLRHAELISERLAEHLRLDTDDLRTEMEEFLEELDGSDQEQAIAHLCDMIFPDSAEPPEDPRSVQFLTIHGSKGLTRKTVVLPGLEDAWLPGSAADDLEEKRRLFYVALTRATNTVLITYPRTRAKRDPMNYLTPGRGQPSRFITESGIDVSEP